MHGLAQSWCLVRGLAFLGARFAVTILLPGRVLRAVRGRGRERGFGGSIPGKCVPMIASAAGIDLGLGAFGCFSGFGGLGSVL